MARKESKKPKSQRYVPLIDVGTVSTGIGKHQRLVLTFDRDLEPPNPTGPQVCDGCPIYNRDHDHIPPKGVVCYGRDPNTEGEHFACGSVFVDLLTGTLVGNCGVRIGEKSGGSIVLERKTKPRQKSASPKGPK